MSNNNKCYKIVIIEPSMIISTGLRKLIETRKEFEVVAVIADCYHCLDRISHLNPDIIIINPSIIELKKRATSGRVVRWREGHGFRGACLPVY